MEAKRKLFLVDIKLTRSCSLYVIGDDRKSVEEAMECEDFDSYGMDESEHVHAVEIKEQTGYEKPKHAELDGEIVEIESEQYKAAFAQTVEPQPVVDTVTLPLFKE